MDNPEASRTRGAERRPRVSVVLPVYNGTDSVERAIRSIQLQTFPDWELLICDDGSRDDSLRICRALEAADPRIRVFANPKNMGIAATLNRLLSEARGEFYAIQEQDDSAVPERLEWEVAQLDRHPEAGVVSGVAAWLGDDGKVFAHFPWFLWQGRPYPQVREELIEFLYVQQSKIVNAAAMVRMSLLRDAGLRYDEEARMSIDFQFFVDAAHRMSVVGIPRILVSMARGKQRESMTRHKELQFREARRCLKILYERYRGEPTSPINLSMYRKAMAYQLRIEARYHGRLRGALLLAGSLFLDPRDRKSWKTVKEFWGRLWRRPVAEAPFSREG
jgi:glycosyltransferase involved in cell wall biosynthesis